MSKDALDILEIAFLTNSNPPVKNISKDEFYSFQKKILIKKKDLDLIKLFLENNRDFYYKDDLINYYANHYLAEANIEKSCEIFELLKMKTIFDDYIIKIKIYCLNKFK